MQMRSKGSVADMVEWMVFVFVLGIMTLITSLLWNEASPEVAAMLGAEGAAVVASSGTVFTILDYFFVFVSFGLGIGAIIFAYLSRFNPIFFFISLIVIGINLILAPVFSNAMREIWSEAEFVAYQTDYPMMLFVFEYYPHVVTVLSTLLSLAMFIGGRNAETGGM